MNHTKGPWEVAHYEDGILEGVNFIRSTVNNYSVCILINGGTSPEETEANAAFIVRACNSHDELIEVLKDAILEIEYLHDKFKTTGSGNATLAKIDAAIAKAEQP